MNLLRKIWEHRWILRSIFSTIYFNFHYLPFKQAIHLPILLYKPHLTKCKGHVSICKQRGVKFGMIRLGEYIAKIYPNNGFVWENHGGTIEFKGTCTIGNNSFLSFGEKTQVAFGDDFKANAAVKIVSFRGVTFGQSTRLGWECLVMDTNFHPLYDMKNEKFKKASGTIEIGDYNWFGTQCKIMHSVKTPERCIFGMNTIITRGCEMMSYCCMGGSPVRVLSKDVMRIIGQDMETYE